jgi:RHS repeat-associated protein
VPTHKHAVIQAGSTAYTYTYDSNGNAMSRNGSGISWTSYNHPAIINGPGESVQFAYNQNHERWSAIYNGSAGVETTYFIGNLLEKVVAVGLTDYRHYIYAGGAKVAIYSRTTGGVNALHYVREDHQGSVAAILNSDGTSYVKESFTAFGARRSACTWSGPLTNGNLTKINAVTRHGYTWQTALGSMGLNDMNARIQDAVTGRFLSPDPTISNPGFTQSYNRYSYVYNNPLSYSDPSGFAPEREKHCNLDCGGGTGSGGGGGSGNDGGSGGEGVNADPIVQAPDPNWTHSMCVTDGPNTYCKGGNDLGLLPFGNGVRGGRNNSGVSVDLDHGDVDKRGRGKPQGNLPEVTVSTNRPLNLPPVIPIAPYLSPYPYPNLQSWANGLDAPYVCRYGRANNPNVGKNMLAGFRGGALVGMGVGAAAIVVINVVGFPEVEIFEGGALATGGGAWLFEAAVAEPGGSIAIGALSGGAYGGAVGFAGGLAVTTPGCG